MIRRYIYIYAIAIYFAAPLQAATAAAEADVKSAPTAKAELITLLDKVIDFPATLEQLKYNLYAKIVEPVQKMFAEEYENLRQTVTPTATHQQLPREITGLIVKLLDSPEARLDKAITVDFVRLTSQKKKYLDATIHEIKVAIPQTGVSYEEKIKAFKNFTANLLESNPDAILGNLVPLTRPTLDLWQAYGFSWAVNNIFYLDRVKCASCDAVVEGLQPWMQPLYYHKDDCKIVKEFAAKGITRKVFGEDVPPKRNHYILLHVDLAARKLVAQDPEGKDPLTEKAKMWLNFHRFISVSYGWKRFAHKEKIEVEM